MLKALFQMLKYHAVLASFLCRDYLLTKNEHLTVVFVFLAINTHTVRLYFLTNTDLAEENVYLR